MNDVHQSFPLFDIVFGWAFFISFVCFLFCLATLRYHVDVTKLTTPEEINQSIKNAIPRRDILTRSGLFRYKLAIISFVVSMVILGAIGIKTFNH